MNALSDLFWRRPAVLLALLLAPPLVWLGLVYLGSLFALLAQSFFSIDEFSGVIDRTGIFLDPVIAVTAPGKGFWTPNGMHRLNAMRRLGARAITALVVPKREIAWQILALNTEKAHNLRERSLEVIRIYRELIKANPNGTETEASFYLEEASLATIGICYEKNPRFSGGAYNSVVSRTESFSTEPMSKSLKMREEHADKLIELDVAVAAAVEKLKAAGFTSGYLKPIVVARVNPLRFVKPGKDDAKPDFDKTVDKMIEGAKKFDPSKVKAQDVAIAAAVGGGEGE